MKTKEIVKKTLIYLKHRTYRRKYTLQARSTFLHQNKNRIIVIS